MTEEDPIKTFISTLALLTISLIPTAAAAAGRTLLYNGRVFTADPARPWATAVALQGNNILAVGEDAMVRRLARQGDRLVDLGGRLVVPGLNDAHVHVAEPHGVKLNSADFAPGPGPTLSEVLLLLEAGAAANPPGTWLVAFVGEAFMEDPNANRFALDVASPHHPVRLYMWTGHGTYLNTHALHTLGISENEPDPVGGRFERFPGTGTLTGLVHEYAEHKVRQTLYAQMTDEELAAQYRVFAEQAVRFGMTTFQDIPVGIHAERAHRILKAAALPVRVRSIAFPLSPEEPCWRQPHSDELIDATGCKWITDGTPIERLAFLTRPYADRPILGEFNFPGEPFHTIVNSGLAGSPRTHQLLFHAVGDGSIQAVLDGLEAAGGAEVWKGRRTRIEHGDLLFPGQFARARDLGVVIVQNPLHLALAPLFLQRFTPEVYVQLQPLRTLLKEGIPFAFGSDSIGGLASPWLDVFMAAIHPTRPSEALTVEEAVRAYTVGSAYAELQEQHKGSLAPGKLADLAVLSQDVFAVPLVRLPETYSVLTIVNGRIVWDTGALASASP